MPMSDGWWPSEHSYIIYTSLTVLYVVDFEKWITRGI